MKQAVFVIIVWLLMLMRLEAVRPFITDDARIVGYRLAQWETWLRVDRYSGQQWHMLAYGPHKRLELTAGAVWGYDRPLPDQAELSYAMPLIQGKFLFREYQPNKPPGVALVAGSFFPAGKGAFVPQGYGTFGFLTISQCFGEKEDLLIHANLGGNYLYVDQAGQLVSTWGIGSQVKLYKGFHLVGEVFSGDPYIPGTGLAYQAGFRHFISEWIQIDATFGQGLAGQHKMPFWGSIGARFVTSKFRKNK
jgi:hypothetical protein